MLHIHHSYSTYADMGQIVYPPPKVLNPWALKTLIMIVIEDRTFKEVVSFEMKPSPI